MTEGISFKCPNCGSPLSALGTAKEVKCEYCGSSVIVPGEPDDSLLGIYLSPEHQQKTREVSEKELRVKNKPVTEEAIQDLQDIYEMVDMDGLNKIEALIAGVKHKPVRGRDLDELNKKIEAIISEQ